MKERVKGLTLLEILMTVIVMSVALVPIMQLGPVGLRNERRIERVTRAAFLAQRRMEAVRIMIINDYTNGGSGYDESATAFASPDATFKYTVADSEASDIKNITVTVWYDEDGDNTIDTYSGAWQEDEVSVVLNTRVADRS